MIFNTSSCRKCISYKSKTHLPSVLNVLPMIVKTTETECGLPA